MISQQFISIVIFIVVIVAIMSEKVHRAVAAITGSVLLVLLRVLSIDACISYIDFNTIGVLIGMMLFVAVVKNSGIFEYIAIKAAKLAKGNPWKIMMFFMLLTAVLSAFLDNVTTVLLMGPMTIAITRMLKINPVPFLMTQILSSNVGGTATLIGDPPNIMIGSAAHLSFMDFIVNLGPAILVILAITILCVYFIYGRHLIVDDSAIQEVLKLDERKSVKDPSLMRKSVILTFFVAIGFMLHSTLGIESCIVALTAACIILIVGKQDVDEIIAGVEWSTIVFFTGLFIVVGGMVEVGVIDKLAHLLMKATEGHMAVTMLALLWISAILSSILDNIPFVATLIPLILTMEQSGLNVTPLWWAISLGACLGGNGTLIGASANVVLSGISNKHGYPITFVQYLKIGYPMMILSVVLSTIYLVVRFV
ncbi:ArsB/NhaD family transporter [Sinanaerobacter sp. ZZT-01]|uniref:ArsB/NhaD family transporter n=1 Tax=Sinanaerobacter sp. ZZT-01 TaxID=3111540 RepID=UPI002D79351B|nr:ArsB/NhaD family transporter [Sinanaerobacter sp. ZZT-01]WRR94452.1 ArsB/NhaD family transporter [Sinanaerobacter sp. ZZT-01]